MPVLETIWDVFLWFFWFFVLFAYLFAVFAVIRDLFRDHTLNGWAKAGWLILLIFLPIITVLIYLIARGKSMGERSERERQAAQHAADQYIREVAGKSPADEIEKARQLFIAGSITEAEYDTLKAKAMA